MAKTTRMGLFVERFIAFNLTRYANDAAMKALFTGLKESELTFDTLTGSGTALRSLTVRSATRHFVGADQSYRAASIHVPEGYDLIEPDIKPNLADVLAKSKPGVYAYKDADGTTNRIIVLLEHGTSVSTQQAVARAMFTAAFHVVVLANDITTDATKLVVDGPCVYGIIPFAVGEPAIVIIPDTDYGQLTNPEDL